MIQPGPELGSDILYEEIPQELPDVVAAQITEHLNQLYLSLTPQSSDKERRRKFLNKLEGILKDEWPNAKIEIRVFGSTMTGLSSKFSDIDVCVVTNEAGPSGISNLYALSEVLSKRPDTEVDLTRIKARVPVIRLYDNILKISCDVIVNHTSALINTLFIRKYVMMDQAVQPFMVGVKQWTKRRKLNDAFGGGTLSTYCWVIMMLHYLLRMQVLPLKEVAELVADSHDRGKATESRKCVGEESKTASQMGTPSFSQGGATCGSSNAINSTSSKGESVSSEKKVGDPHSKECDKGRREENDDVVPETSYSEVDRLANLETTEGPRLGQIFYRFFRYFALEYDYEQHAAAARRIPRSPRAVPAGTVFASKSADAVSPAPALPVDGAVFSDIAHNSVNVTTEGAVQEVSPTVFEHPPATTRIGLPLFPGHSFAWHDELILTKEEKGWHLFAPYRRGYNVLCVEDPFNPTRNLANNASSATVRGLQGEFWRICQTLVSCQAASDVDEVWNYLFEEFEFPQYDEVPLNPAWIPTNEGPSPTGQVQEAGLVSSASGSRHGLPRSDSTHGSFTNASWQPVLVQTEPTQPRPGRRRDSLHLSGKTSHIRTSHNNEEWSSVPTSPTLRSSSSRSSSLPPMGRQPQPLHCAPQSLFHHQQHPIPGHQRHQHHPQHNRLQHHHHHNPQTQHTTHSHQQQQHGYRQDSHLTTSANIAGTRRPQQQPRQHSKSADSPVSSLLVSQPTTSKQGSGPGMLIDTSRAGSHQMVSAQHNATGSQRRQVARNAGSITMSKAGARMMNGQHHHLPVIHIGQGRGGLVRDLTPGFRQSNCRGQYSQPWQSRGASQRHSYNGPSARGPWSAGPYSTPQDEFLCTPSSRNSGRRSVDGSPLNEPSGYFASALSFQVPNVAATGSSLAATARQTTSSPTASLPPTSSLQQPYEWPSLPGGANPLFRSEGRTSTAVLHVIQPEKAVQNIFVGVPHPAAEATLDGQEESHATTGAWSMGLRKGDDQESVRRLLESMDLASKEVPMSSSGSSPCSLATAARGTSLRANKCCEASACPADPTIGGRGPTSDTKDSSLLLRSRGAGSSTVSPSKGEAPQATTLTESNSGGSSGRKSKRQKPVLIWWDTAGTTPAKGAAHHHPNATSSATPERRRTPSTTSAT